MSGLVRNTDLEKLDHQVRKTVVELPEQIYLDIQERQARIEHKLDELLHGRKLPTDDFLTLQDFMAKTGLKRTTCWAMANNTHTSGFHLRTKRPPGTKEIWVPVSELDRWLNFFENQHPELKKLFQS